jgi:hypothetical protein
MVNEDPQGTYFKKLIGADAALYDKYYGYKDQPVPYQPCPSQTGGVTIQTIRRRRNMPFR